MPNGLRPFVGGLVDVTLTTATSAPVQVGALLKPISFGPIEPTVIEQQAAAPVLIPHVLQPNVYPSPGPITGVTMSI